MTSIYLRRGFYSNGELKEPVDILREEGPVLLSGEELELLADLLRDEDSRGTE